MSNLTKNERIKLERYFEMASGYVLNFSNRTLDEFVFDHVGIDIYDDKYDINGTSKANRIRALWDIESNNIVAELIEHLINHKIEKRTNDFYSSMDHNDSLRVVCESIVKRLRDDNSSGYSIKNNQKPIKLKDTRFKVSFSFAGENREYVKSIKDILQQQLQYGNIFYDEDYTSQLAIPNMDLLLQKIYHDNSDLIVIFLCKDYEDKEWCGLEWRAIRNLIKQKASEALMFLRFDNTDIPGSFGIDGYIDLSKYSPTEIAQFINERIRLNSEFAI